MFKMSQNPVSIPFQNQCILCGRCLEVCPLFRTKNKEELSPRSKGLFLLDLNEKGCGSIAARKLAGLCLSCGRCQKACPQGLDIPDLVSRIKASSPSWQKFMWKEINRGLPVLLPALSRTRGLVPAPGGLKPYAQALRRTRPEPIFRITGDQGLQGQKFFLFPGCLAKNSWPWLGQVARDILEMRGAEVLDDPGWSCCGYSLASAGLREQAENGLKKNILKWEQAGRPKIAVFCATCFQGLGSAAKLGPDAPGSEAFAQSIIYLPDILSGIEAVPRTQAPPDIFWHVPCHAPAKEHIPEPVPCLEKAGTAVRVEKDSCCGLGGSMLLEDMGLCSSVAQDFWTKTKELKDPLVVTACSGCVLQLTATRPGNRQVIHWLELFNV